MKILPILVYIVLMLLIFSSISTSISVKLRDTILENKYEKLSRDTTTFQSIASDGYISKDDNDYNTVWSASQGSNMVTSSGIGVGQMKYGPYVISRGYLIFITESIPANAEISSAYLRLYGYGEPNNDFYLTVQNGQPTYPHNPLQIEDYDKDHYSGNGGQLYTSGWSASGYNILTLNSYGLSWIQKGTGAKTKFCLRSDKDISGVPPASGAYDYVGFYGYEEGAGFRPELVVEYTYNVPPNSPNQPSGPTSGVPGSSYEYSTITSDPDGDQIYYKFDWGDGSNSGWVGPYNSGSTGYASHTWDSEGSYNVKAKAKDTNNQESGWSSILVVQINNYPPNTPIKPNGPTSGHHGVQYCYSSSATDPENQQVKIYFDWGDGTGTWTSYVNSGQTVEKCHTWSNPGNYQIKAKAKDEFGEESGWSSSLSVSLTNQAPYNPGDPNPNPGETWVDIDTKLSWTGGDPNGDTVYYDVYLGTSNPPGKVADDLTSTTYDPSGELEELKTYYWKIEAEDYFGVQVTGPIWSFITREYNPPILEKYNGWPTGHIPDSGTQQTDFTFRIHYEDPDGDAPVEKKLIFDNGKEFNMNLFEGSPSNGEYEIVLKGSQIGGGLHTYWFWFKDVKHSVRFPEIGEEWAITINHPPNKPIISGPGNGVPDKEYTFSSHTNDPEGEDIKYYFDWGDGENTGWIPYEEWKSSGDSISHSHIWENRGTYNVKVKAMDKSGDISQWSDPIPLNIPKNRALINIFSFEHIIHKFSIFEKILDFIFLIKIVRIQKNYGV